MGRSLKKIIEFFKKRMETEWYVTVKFSYNNTMYICVNVCKHSKSINVG